MVQPLVSFIIPSYNIPETMIRECVESVCELDLQTDEFEVIIVDDGSDIPVQNPLPLNSSHVTVVRQDNQGLSAARNAGMDIARGEYIQFLDADDKLLKDSYDRCLHMLRQERPDILKFLYTDSEKQTTRHLSSTTWTSGADFMMANNLQPGACAYLFRRSLLGNLKFTRGIYHEDEEFTTLLFLRAGKTVITDARAYYYYKRSDSITLSLDSGSVRKRLDDFYNVILRIKSLCTDIKNGKTHEANELPTYKTESKAVNALQRRLNQASVDYIINVIRLHRREKHGLSGMAKYRYVKKKLDTALTQMKSDSLFPLPPASCNRKYSLFRLLANHKPLRNILLLAV